MEDKTLKEINADITDRVVRYRFADDELDWKEIYDQAMILATREHQGQTYGGKKDRELQEPYINHPIRVSFRCKTKRAKIVALLHDVVEDTDVTIKELIERGFPKFVCDAVDAMTHRKDEDYFDYVRRACLNPIAKEVKLADLDENSSSIPSLYEQGETKWADKLTKKYGKARKILEEE